MNIVEEAYYEMASVLNKSNNYDVIIESLEKSIMSLLQFINTGIPIDNYMVYNILLVANLFIRKNEAKFCYVASFENLKILLNLINNNVENTQKR